MNSRAERTPDRPEAADAADRLGDSFALRHEVVFGTRVVRCFAERPADLAAMLRGNSQMAGDSDAFVCGDERITWAQADALSAQIAGGFRAEGVTPGDRVALLLSNGIPFALAVLALARLGAICVPVSPREERAGLEYILAHAEAKLLLHDHALAHLVVGMNCAPRNLRTIAVPGPGYEALLSSEPGGDNAVDQDDAAVIMYTSGTTGRPKGAVITHRNIIHSSLNFVRLLELGPSDRALMTVPMSHVTGLVALFATALAARATLVMIGDFKVEAFLAAAEAERMTYTVMVPTMYNLLLLRAKLEERELATWRVAAYGGALMPLATIERLAAALPNLSLFNIYGATETTSPATMLPAAYAGSHVASVGRAVPGAEILVMDESGREVAQGQTGEFWIKGPMVVREYWRDPAATANGIVSGFWKSGDIGRQDAGGFLYVLDRSKDMVNRGGYKIYSAEVENAVTQHPMVVECAVVGRPCPVLGERVHAFVVGRGDQLLDAADLAERLTGQLAPYKMPESWSIGTTPLPRNANGKVLKQVLRDTLADAAGVSSA